MEKDWLEKNEAPHDVIYVDDDPKAAEELIARTGQHGVPQIEVAFEDGSAETIVGFDKKRLEQIVATM